MCAASSPLRLPPGLERFWAFDSRVQISAAVAQLASRPCSALSVLYCWRAGFAGKEREVQRMLLFQCTMSVWCAGYLHLETLLSAAPGSRTGFGWGEYACTGMPLAMLTYKWVATEWPDIDTSLFSQSLDLLSGLAWATCQLQETCLV